MKALVYSQPGVFSVRNIKTPEINENQVLIKVKACGICKTDVHIHNGKYISRFPLTPGHEFTGIIEAHGEKVANLKKGDRVVAYNTIAYSLRKRAMHAIHCADSGHVGGSLSVSIIPASSYFMLYKP
jgi:D-arabinose 1-dehydrogenase-like Zn-dependent alcohol dehydrogenase